MKNYFFIPALLFFFLLNSLKGQSLQRDLSFNNNLSTTNTSVRNIAVYADQRMLVCGDFSNFNGTLRRSLIRLESNGDLDPGFSSPVLDGLVHSIAIQPWDNKIVIGGSFTTVNGASLSGLARLNIDGSLDVSFAIGSGISSGYGDDLSVRSVVIIDNPDPARRYIYAGGQFQVFNGASIGTRGGLVRVRENGTRDASYNPQVTNGPVYTMKADASGKLVIGGEFWYIAGAMQVRVARLNTDGTRDLSFNTNPFGPYSSVTGIGIDPSGRILIGGWFTKFNGIDHNHIVRLLPNGTIDNSFNTGSGLQNGLSTNTNGTEARTFAFLSDGTIVVGGNFTRFNGIACGNIICLKDDGSLSDWSTGDGFNDNVMSLQLQQPVAGEERIVAGGFFNNYQSYVQGTVMRLIPMMNVLKDLPLVARSRERLTENESNNKPSVLVNKNEIRLRTAFAEAGNWEISLITANGQLLRSWNKHIAAGNQRSDLPINNISQQYFILIMKNQTQLLTVRCTPGL